MLALIGAYVYILTYLLDFVNNQTLAPGCGGTQQ